MPQQITPQIFEDKPLRMVKRGEVLVQAGQRAHEAFYVVKGCLRSYIIDSKGKEHIYQFAPEDWIISDLEFLKNKSEAYLIIDAIEDSEVMVANIADFYQISTSNPEMIDNVLNKMQSRVYSLQKRVIQLLAYTAEERYMEFIKTYPNLYNRVPLKMIASYLGVTPESLSRVRKELVKSK